MWPFPEHLGIYPVKSLTPLSGEEGRCVQVLCFSPWSASYFGQDLFYMVHGVISCCWTHSKKGLKGRQWNSKGGTEPACFLPFPDPFLGARSNPLFTCCWTICSGDAVHGLYLLWQWTSCYSCKLESHQNGKGGADWYALPTPEMWDQLLQTPLGRGGSWVCPHPDCNYWACVGIRIFPPASVLWHYLASSFLFFLWG